MNINDLSVARDESGQLWLFSSKPVRYNGFWASENTEFMKLPNDFFPELTWDDEPREVKLIISHQDKTPWDLMDDKIKELESLDYYNWDGYNAMPVDKKSIENLQRVFRYVGKWDFHNWQVAPGVNGDIYLNYKLDYPNAGIIIRPDTFTYFIETDELNGDTTEFDPQQLYKIMCWIQQLNETKE